jgi:hypothetical protein
MNPASAIAIKTAIFTDAQVEEAALALVGALKATKTARRRSGGGMIDYVEEPDHALRIVAATKIVEFGRGKAVSMNLTADLTPKGGEVSDGQEFMKALMADPEARAALRDTALKIADTADRMKPVEVVATVPKSEKGAKSESLSGGSKR